MQAGAGIINVNSLHVNYPGTGSVSVCEHILGAYGGTISRRCGITNADAGGDVNGYYCSGGNDSFYDDLAGNGSNNTHLINGDDYENTSYACA